MAWVLPLAQTLDWYNVLCELLPKGPIWGRIEREPFKSFWLALAAEPARVHNRILQLVEESDPRTTTELLDAWEVALGLPSACTTNPPSDLNLRRNAAAGKLAAVGGATGGYIKQVCAEHGANVDIIEPKPFRAGSTAGSPAYGEDWAFAFIVNVHDHEIHCFVAGSHAGEPICDFGDESLTCLIDLIKPKHTVAVFDWS